MNDLMIHLKNWETFIKNSNIVLPNSEESIFVINVIVCLITHKYFLKKVICNDI
jgi:hypothetical protein